MIDLKNWMSKVTNAIACETGTDYIRFDNGLQICWINDDVSMAMNNTYGSLYQGVYTWYFSKSFSTVPAVAVGHCQWGTSASWGTLAGATKTSASIRGMDAFSRASGTTHLSAIAIGYWK